MRTRFDQLAKEIVSAALEPGGEVATEYEVVGPAQAVDIWFRPDPTRADALTHAGLLGRMAREIPEACGCMIEPYRGTPGIRQMQSCILKQYALHHEQALAARRTGEPPPPLARLWVVSSGRPEAVLREYAMQPMPGWPPGCYRSPAVIHGQHVVVLRELPATRDTLLLRLLSRGPTFRRAAAELEALPPDAWEKQLAVPVLVAFRMKIPQALQDDAMQEFLQHTREIYAEWERRTREEGREEGRQQGREEGRRAECALVLRILAKKFGALPDETVARIEGAGVAELERIAERAITADTLAAALAD